MIFGHISIQELVKIKELLDLYYKTINMVINMNKSRVQAEILFPMNLGQLDQGVKYFGFMLKPNAYHYVDWNCLYKKVEV